MQLEFGVGSFEWRRDRGNHRNGQKALQAPPAYALEELLADHRFEPVTACVIIAKVPTSVRWFLEHNQQRDLAELINRTTSDDIENSRILNQNRSRTFQIRTHLS